MKHQILQKIERERLLTLYDSILVKISYKHYREAIIRNNIIDNVTRESSFFGRLILDHQYINGRNILFYVLKQLIIFN